MSDSTSRADVARQKVLGTIKRLGGVFRVDLLMNHLERDLALHRDGEMKTIVLTYWNDLLRSGHIVRENPGKPSSGAEQYFLSEPGLRAIDHASRDPSNQEGYLAYLDREVAIDQVTRGYVEEALNTYRACCYKATAVMIGAAVENLVLDLRDALVKGLGAKTPAALKDWRAKPVLEAIAKIVLPDLKSEAKRSGSDELRELHDEAEARLHPAAAEFRKTRNNAGHPASLDPVEPADVHCNLLLFPATAKLIRRLKEWVVKYYI